jgi:hypothetical protein
MKNYLKLGILLIGILFFQNCSEDNLEDKIESTLHDPVVQELLDSGYKLDDIQELENFYLVQGDLLFSKDINDYKKNKSGQGGIYARHASTNNLVSQTNVTSMTVYIDASVSVSGVDNWTSAITNAINDFNSVSGSKVNFVITTNISTADIIIKSDNGALPNNVIAAAGFPSNNKPYNLILINLDFSSNITVSESSKRYNIVHELGHCIGLRHTNWDITGEGVGPGANYIPNTPSQDPNSVMNGGTANYTWNGFSAYDIIAINYLYPVPQISGAYLICGGSQIYTLSGGTATSWQVSSNLQVLSSSGTSATIQPVNSSTNGPGYVDAVTSSGTIRYNVWVNKFNQGTLTGTNAVCPSQAYHYTITVPGGHKPGYTYRWTMPTSDWNIYGSSSGPTIYAGPSGSNVAGQMLVEVNTGCGGWALVGGLITYPSYSCP